MNWVALYQVSTFLATALLAIVVTIFVFASSLLGRAIESAAKEEEEKRREQDKRVAEKVKEARKALNKAIEGTGEFEEARKSLYNLEKQKRNLEREKGVYDEAMRFSLDKEVYFTQAAVFSYQQFSVALLGRLVKAPGNGSDLPFGVSA